MAIPGFEQPERAVCQRGGQGWTLRLREPPEVEYAWEFLRAQLMCGKFLALGTYFPL